MRAVGIICEYNPFHNGHLYHLKQVKSLYPDAILVLVVSGPFLQRGEASLLSKWDKTELALSYGVDICIELPFAFATASADIFAHGAIQILNEMQVDAIVFGSECNDAIKLTKLAFIQTKEEYQQAVKTYLKEGFNYPTALSKALALFTTDTVSSPNDLLGLSYIKEIIKINPLISPVTIQRTNGYHDTELKEAITSASSIRNAIRKKQDIRKYVPKEVISRIKEECVMEHYYPFLRYKILTEKKDILKYQGVDEKIAARILKFIESSDNLSDFIQNVKSKKDTYNRINRILLYILCNYTKEEAHQNQDVLYLRLLGFSQRGRKYLNEIKKEFTIPLLTNYSNDKNHLLDLDFRAIQIYSLVLENASDFIKQEYQKMVIVRNNKDLT